MKDTGIKRLYYSISEVSRIADEEQYVLRYWETEFEQLRPQKNRAGNRIYTDKDISVIRSIKRLLREKRYTIEGAKEVMRHYRPELGDVPEEFLTDADILRTTTEKTTEKATETGNEHDAEVSAHAPLPVQPIVPMTMKTSATAISATNGLHEDALHQERTLHPLTDAFPEQSFTTPTSPAPLHVPPAFDDVPPPTSPSLLSMDVVSVPSLQSIAEPPLEQATHLLHSLDASPAALQSLTREELEELRSVLQHVLQLLA
jgi:DNA-binding transcriptional MerR regulator